ncbi:MAG: response regulator [Bacteroidales bacterium]|nr:response regulator [Bacteroidales bacterium]
MKRPEHNWKNEKILIADDDIYSYLLLEKVLKKTHAKVIYAANGKEALDFIDSDYSITVAILDIIMPKLSGLEVLEFGKKIRPDIIYIAYTADAIGQDKADCIAKGFFRCIVKPALPVKMLKIISDAVSIRKEILNTNS